MRARLAAVPLLMLLAAGCLGQGQPEPPPLPGPVDEGPWTVELVDARFEEAEDCTIQAWVALRNPRPVPARALVALERDGEEAAEAWHAVPAAGTAEAAQTLPGDCQPHAWSARLVDVA